MEEVKLTVHERWRRLLCALKASGPTPWAKLVAILVPIAHLILTPVHVSALLKLENQICGFAMFLSVLVGLVVLFEATRVKDDEIASKFLFVLFLVADMLLLLWLSGIYRHALVYQQTLREPEKVVKAITLSISIMGFYGLSLALAIASFFVHGGNER